MQPNKINELDFISSIFVNRCVEKLGDNLVGMYFYGSSVSGDFTITSDYDFVAVVKEISSSTLGIVKDILESLKTVPGCYKLEGGFHTISSENPWEDSVGIWVDKGMIVSECAMHIEHDSVFAIRATGKQCYGASPSELLPKLSEGELIQFETNYIYEFIENIPRRAESAQRLYGALLNACRSACYVVDREYLSKTNAAAKICSMLPDLKGTIEKALSLRHITKVVNVTSDDINSCKIAINTLQKYMKG